MSSLKKIRKIASREKERNRIKSQERLKNHIISKKKLANKEFRKGIREALGFHKLKIIGIKDKAKDLDFWWDKVIRGDR